LSEEKKGKLERRWRALYRHGGSSVKAGSKEELREEEMRFTAGRRRWKKRWRKEMTCGARGQWEEEGKRVPVRKSPGWAAGRLWCWAGMVPRVPFLVFISFSSFPFLFSFLEFAY
jgi:hypothetical protein